MKRNKLVNLVLVFVLCLSSVKIVNATTIDEAQKKANDLEAAKKSAETEQKSLANQLNQIIDEMKKAEEDLTAKEQEIAVAEDELVQAKIEEDNQYESMKLRIRYMYENGNTDFIEILMKAKDISDFLNKAEYVAKISEYDRDMLIEFQRIVEDVAQKEEQLKTEYQALEELQNQLTTKQAQVETLFAEKSVEISQLDKEIGANAAVLQELSARAAAAEKAKADAAAAAAAAAANKPSTGGGTVSGGKPGAPVVSGNGQFTHPCPGSYLSSGFGYRDFDHSFHNGNDYANHGTSLPTYAAAAGTVVTAGWSASAGNWVVINHGNGLVTKYMHHSALYVSAGQSVVKGQQLGMTGNTGNSAGVHLHFQVELNGTPVNPNNYL